jgi:hypothetical protein
VTSPAQVGCGTVARLVTLITYINLRFHPCLCWVTSPAQVGCGTVIRLVKPNTSFGSDTVIRLVKPNRSYVLLFWADNNIHDMQKSLCFLFSLCYG